MVSGEWVPIAGFAMIVAITALIVHFLTARARAAASGGGDYRRLAEEAVRGQRAVLDEVQRMNATLKEIEKLLREV